MSGAKVSLSINRAAFRIFVKGGGDKHDNCQDNGRVKGGGKDYINIQLFCTDLSIARENIMHIN